MTDPLRGRDPYPQEQLQLVDLHRERAELLEEIVSTPGPGQTATPARTRVLLAVGIAAALVIVGGGVWFATSSGDDSGDDTVAAATSSPTAGDTATDPAASETTPTDEPSATRSTVPLSHAKKGDVLSHKDCRAGRGNQPPDVVRRHGSSLYLLGLRRGVRGDRGAYLRAVPGGKHNRWMVIDKDCTVVAVGGGARPLRLPGLLGQRPRGSR